jgi:23S rRNA (uracil1939-C5)-methyltransferase
VGASFVIEIESLDLEGRGVGRRDGMVVFVEGALPGERVLATPTRSKPSYEVARVSEILRESALRVRPACPHFGVGPGHCGGCAMQHLEPRAQVAIKQRVLEDALWHLGRVRPQQILRAVHGPAWGYRHRARLAVRHVPRKGGALVGFHERASSYVADMRECHVLPPHLSRLLLPLRELVGRLSIRDRVPQVEVAVATGAGGAQTVLVFRHLLPLGDADREALAEFAASHGVSVWLQPGGPQTAAPLDPHDPDRLLLGLPEFGVSLPFAPTDFTQVNHGINEVLVRVALRLLEPRADAAVADFFCGLGNFSLPLATRAAQVIGLEGHAGLVERAAQAARHAGLAARTRFVTRNLFEWSTDDWEALDAEAGGIAGALLDPPREGALAVVQALARSPRRPRRLVYVSCNPATLARDCAVLVHEGGWQLVAAGVVNMFPHTAHVESIALLAPAGASATLV